MESEVYCSQECRLIHESAKTRIETLEKQVADHRDRFDTLQTPFLKRLIFWLDGWPWHNLNSEKPANRPWRRWWTS